VKILCSICGDPLDTAMMTTYVKVVAWVEWRGERAVGTVKNPSAPVGYAHKMCVESPKSRDQVPLF
jgi:hypothetical protein